MLLWIYCFRLFFIRTFVCLSISWSTAWNLGSFKVYSLFSYQCTANALRCPQKLLRNFWVDFSTSLAVVISRRQLIYYIILSTVCQQLFLFSFASFSEAVVVCVTYFTRQLIHNIMYRSVCQQLFQKKIEQLISSNKAEKEGFEPSRRLTRPIPLAGAPLRPLEYFSKVLIWQYDIVLRRDA